MKKVEIENEHPKIDITLVMQILRKSISHLQLFYPSPLITLHFSIKPILQFNSVQTYESKILFICCMLPTRGARQSDPQSTRLSELHA